MTVAIVLLAAPVAHGASTDRKGRYYVSLGDSLAVGVQPNGPPPQQETDEGYADQLHALLATAEPKLRLRKLGCPGESAISMRLGSQDLRHASSCGPVDYYRHRYPHKTQLAEAVAFLRAHADKTALVTIGIGANDTVRHFGDPVAFDASLQRLDDDLGHVLSALRTAAGPEVPIVAMTYYNPFLGSWLGGADGQAFALFTNGRIQELNAKLRHVFARAGVPVADIEGAFAIADFTDADSDGVPDNVERACEWTWWCSSLGPDVHATTAGYGVMARAFLAVL